MEAPVTPWLVNSTYKNDTESLRNLIAPAWVPSPAARGTIDILQSCVITLIACIYTALHLNVPNSTVWYTIIWSHIRWTSMSLFAPEIVLYMALDQFYQATKFKNELLSLQRKGKIDSNVDINLKYAFFVVMGGVHIDISDIMSEGDLDEDETMKGRTRGMKKAHSNCYSARLTPRGVVRLAMAKALPNVRNEEIEDKSKSNYLQKFLVIMQVTWMVVQCITRKVIGLPLTLLEIHTMVHVGCTIILYICWLEKPLDVKEPKIFQISELESDKDPKAFTKLKGEIALAVQQLFYAKTLEFLSIFGPQTSGTHDGVTLKPGSTIRTGVMMASGLRIDNCEYDFKIEQKFLHRWDRIFAAFSFSQLCEMNNISHGMSQSESYTRLLDHQQDEEQAHKRKRSICLRDLAKFTVYRLYPRKLMVSGGEKNLDVHFFNRNILSLWGSAMNFISAYYVLGILLTVLSAIYGGIHLVAWNQNFPSEIESWAWKISAIIIAAAFPIWYAGSIITSAIVSNMILIRRPHFIPKVVGILASWLLWPQIAVYTLARIYIVAEAFANLRHIPIGAYLTPDWTQLLPHLGR